MSQIIPVGCVIDEEYADQAIGYKLLTIDKKLYSSWKQVGQSYVPLVYTTQVTAPSTGGYILWGLIDRDLYVDTIEPEVTIPDFKSTLSSLLDKLNMMVLPVPSIELQVDTKQFDNKLNELITFIDNSVADYKNVNVDNMTKLVSQLDDLINKYNQLKFLNEASVQQSKLEDLRVSLNEFMLGNSVRQDIAVSLDRPSDNSLEVVMNKIEELNLAKDKAKKKRDLDIVTKFLNKLEVS